VIKRHPQLTVVYESSERWTIPGVLADRARSHADAPFIVEGQGSRRSFTYAEVYSSAEAIAQNLTLRGFEAGDRLGIILDNCPEFILAWFGASLAGVIEVPVNVDYHGTFLEHAVNLTSPRGMVTSPRFVPTLLTSYSSLPRDMFFFIVPDLDSGSQDEAVAQAVVALSQGSWQAEAFTALMADRGRYRSRVGPSDLASILFTSGTTGPSKGVMMPHSQMMFVGQEIVCAAQLTDADVLQLSNPLFHGNAQFMTTLPAVLAGASVVVFDRFSTTNFLGRVREHGITMCNLLGPMMDWLWHLPTTPSDQSNSLRCIISCPTPASIAESFGKRFGVDMITEVFGQTEICLPFMVPYGQPRPPSAVGLLVEEYFEVDLVNPESGEPVALGETGELLVRGKQPGILNCGYWGMADATRMAFRDGWFHTGDGLRQDQEGWYYFTDRMKDALRRRGENISSFEVEQALLRHEAVSECAVIAVPADFEGGEDEVKAVVVLRHEVDWSDMARWADEQLPYFVVPRYWEAVTALPKTPSSKVQKAVLRAVGVTPQTFDRVAANVETARHRGHRA
jgi:carnitine-CoA ligase